MATGIGAMEANMVDRGVLVGSIRRFGLEGPSYEVIGAAVASPTGDPRMRIHLLESNEDVDYPVRDILADPVEG
jgi:hypothetical protein